MNEMNLLSLRLGSALLICVEARFDRPPIEGLAPIRHPLLHRGEIGAIAPVRTGQFIRPPDVRESRRDIVEIGFRDGYRESLDGHGSS